MATEHIKRIDEYGNIDGYGGSELLAGEMIRDQAVSEGCDPYSDPSNAPVYGSSSTAGLSKVIEKKE